DADACAAPNATSTTTPTTASNPKRVLMLVMASIAPPWFGRLLRVLQANGPQPGTGAELRLRCQPPIRRGCQHGDAASGAEPAYLVRKAFDVDRLLEVAGESGVREPGGVSFERDRAQRDHGDRRCPRPVREDPGSFRTVHVRQSEVHQDDVRKMLGTERDGLRAVPGN